MHSWLLALLATGCFSKWEAVDGDGDGLSAVDGDCWDYPNDPIPPEGAMDYGVRASDIYVGAEDLPYDGIDANCDGLDDFDQDGDGFVPDMYVGLVTIGVDESGALPGGDCYDEVIEQPIDGRLGTAVFSGADVFPNAEDLPYDGIDANCDGLDDFDQDGDGFVPNAFEGFTTFFAGLENVLPAGDCWDDATTEFEDPTTTYQPSEVHPDALEVYYDGTDANCDGLSDCDQDEDGFDVLTEYCVNLVAEDSRLDCNDVDSTIFPNDNPEIYFNGIDDNCDSRDGDGDRDGDGFWSTDYPFTDAEVDASVTLPDNLDDCWDDPDNIPEGFVSLNGFAQLPAVEVHPMASDAWYDGIPQDCVDNSDFDQDGDGFASSYYANRDGAFGADCIDSIEDPDFIDVGVAPVDIYPGNPTEVYYDGVDQNCDFFSDFDQDEDGQDAEGFGGDDCNDTNPDIYFDPNLPEGVNDGIDQNCDLMEACYIDFDQDGFGNPEGGTNLSTDLSCTGEVGFSNNTQDCDDSDSTISPTALEICDGQVNTCGGSLPSDEIDNDGDGFVECTIDSNGWDDSSNLKQGGDCDDGDGTLNPNTVWYADTDTDGFGDSGNTQTQCLQPAGFIADNTDCNDSEVTIFPNAPELCDGQVNACGGSLPSNEIDNDGDGFVECTIDSNGWDDSSNLKQDGDCNDSDSTISPTALEICDGQVNTCGGSLPSNEIDNDGDGFVECTIDSNGWDDSSNLKQGGDCDDGDETLSPNTVWYADTDTDGFGDSGNTQTQCQQPTGFIADNTDCDDTDGTVSPTATELCDGQVNICGGAFSPDEIDNDGDGFVECTLDSGGWDGAGSKQGDDCDDNNASINPTTLWYADTDTDGFGDSGNTQTQCLQPAGYISDNQDCDDSEVTIFPNAPELCDGQVNTCGGSLPSNEIDNDGDGFVECTIDSNGWDDSSNLKQGGDCDDGDGTLNPNTVWYADTDTDGFGDSGNTQTQCLQPAGYISDNQDCDDDDATLSPNTVWYADTDTDGFGDSGNTQTQCLQPTGYTSDNQDCDDGDGTINPNTVWYADIDTDGFGDSGNTQTQCLQPNGYVLDDTDCDDDDATLSPNTVWYADTDTDGFGASGSTQTQCLQPAGYISDNQDCDDDDGTVYPGAFDIFDDGIDQDCDGTDATGLTGDELLVGDLIITEMMVDTHIGYNDEWFEVYNTTSETIDLFGLYIEDNNLNNRKQIPDHVEIPPNSYFVFVSNDAPQSNGGFDWSNIPHYDYPFIQFNNGADDIALVYDDGASQLVLFEIVYTNSGTSDFHYARGVSAIVDDETIVSNNDPDLWCSSRTLYHTNVADGTEYYGTPGAVNDVCDDDGDTHFYYADGDGDCDDGNVLIYPGAVEVQADGVDQDCDGFEQCIVDSDQDGFGNQSGTLGLSATLSCNAAGFALNTDDCDDGDANIYPWAPETADGANVDENCDGLETLSTPITGCTGASYYDSTLSLSTYYLICTDMATWQSFINICQDAGYDGTPKVSTADQNAYLEPLADNFWIGLEGPDQNGDYVWQDGTVLGAYTNFHSSGGTPCFRMRSDGRWDDRSCTESNKIACSIELP